MQPDLHIDWSAALWNAVYLLGSFLLSLPLAWNQDRAKKLGLRTMPLVAVASTGLVLISRQTFTGYPEAQARVVMGVISGIGFLGAGAIIKDNRSVHGTATAASIWTTAGLGIAFGFGRFEIAVLLAIGNLVIVRSLRPILRIIEDLDDPSDDEEDAAEE